jgi:hypothetical protein
MLNGESRLGNTPLTDPRSIASSVAVHVLLLIVASAVALTVTAPQDLVKPRAVRGELEQVDNRADPNTEGGGSPGALGGMGDQEFLPRPLGATPEGAADRSAADALISDILPAKGKKETTQRTLPGPDTTGVGALPGPGTGGGGGSGGGSGGGVGKGAGPGTEFFGARENAGSFAYVIDCSGSMAAHRSLENAKRELMSSLNQLPPDALFGVVFYNLSATVFSDPAGRKGMMLATASNKNRVRAQLAAVAPDGGTDHMAALRAALRLQPEVIFFLTDADLMLSTDVDEILSERGRTRINCIEFGRGFALAGDGAPLKRLATATGGRYRYIDVTEFPNY